MQVSITDDHLYMAFSVFQDRVYVYSYNGTNFTLYQSIPFIGGNWKYVALSQDHRYLSISGASDNYVKIYQNNGSSFNELPNNGTINFPSGSTPTHASFS